MSLFHHFSAPIRHPNNAKVRQMHDYSIINKDFGPTCKCWKFFEINAVDKLWNHEQR
jgi:hypothetical protein